MQRLFVFLRKALNHFKLQEKQHRFVGKNLTEQKVDLSSQILPPGDNWWK